MMNGAERAARLDAGGVGWEGRSPGSDCKRVQTRSSSRSLKLWARVDFVIFQVLEHGLLLSVLGLRSLKARL